MTPERWQQIKDVLGRALELDAPQRSALLDESCRGDPVLRSEVDHLLSANLRAGAGFMNTADHAPVLTALFPEEGNDPRIGHRFGPYEIVEHIAEGGMGDVYRAFRADDQYRKQVAIKLVSSGQDSRLVLARFRNERQVLASLDHPNIARLFDGGTTGDGVPYVVMEFIDGLPIHRYCDDHKLATSERLKLFLQVCSAVQYAHQHLVIHRDIKPGNVLVTSDGIPKLLDFGIAKILDPSVAAEALDTNTMFRPMTPAYASPEQMRGEAITTASDVYSLGVLLYELLTGSLPYQIHGLAPHEMARVVCETEPERPSAVVLRDQTTEAGLSYLETSHTAEAISAPRDGTPDKVSKRLRGDIDNIVAMALRKEPHRRYASVEQFATDIRRHLENLPVIARKDTTAYRISKFVTRHKAAVASTALATATLIAALLITLHEAHIAQRRFNDVRSLANSLIFDVHDAIQDLPGSTSARKLIVAKALQYLDNLAQQSQNDPSLQRELAAGYRRIGEVDASNLGDHPGALASFKKALAIRQALVGSRNGTLDDLVEFAELTRQVAKESMLRDVKRNEALDIDKQAAQTLEAALATHKDNPQIVRELMLNYASQASILSSAFALSQMGNIHAGIEPRRRQVELARQLCNLQPANLDARRDLAAAIGELGDLLYLSGEENEALHDYADSQRMLEDTARQSSSPKIQLALYDSYYRMAPIRTMHGDLPGAIRDAHRLVEISGKLSQDDPQNTLPRLLLAAAYSELADVISRTTANTARSDATANMGYAINVDTELIRTHPANTEFRDMQAVRFRDAGAIFLRLGAPETALHYFEQAVAVFEIKLKDPSDAGARNYLAGSYNGLGFTLLALHRARDAKGAFQKALPLSDTKSASREADEEALYLSADSYTGLGEVEASLAANPHVSLAERIQHWQDARMDYEHSLKIWSQVAHPKPQSPEGFDCIPLAAVNQRLGDVNSRLQTLRAPVTHPTNSRRE